MKTIAHDTTSSVKVQIWYVSGQHNIWTTKTHVHKHTLDLESINFILSMFHWDPAGQERHIAITNAY